MCSGKMCAAEMYCQLSYFSGLAPIHHMKKKFHYRSFMDSFHCHFFADQEFIAAWSNVWLHLHFLISPEQLSS